MIALNNGNTKTETENETVVKTEATPEDKTMKDVNKDPWKLELFEKEKESEAKDKVSIPEPVKRDVSKLKLQRSLSQPFSLTQLNLRKNYNNKSLPNNDSSNNDQSNASDLYIYSLPWACCAMILWKNISLLPLLPLPILIYMLKHLGFYLGIWQWVMIQLESVSKIVGDWCSERFDALVPVPIRGLYRGIVKFNGSAKENIKDSIDTVSSIVVILGLIVFVTCASVFFAIQVIIKSVNRFIRIMMKYNFSDLCGDD